MRGDLRVQRSMRSGIRDVDSSAEYRHREAAGVERRAMRRGVDPARQPAHDRDAGAAQGASQLVCHAFAVRGRVTRSNDRHHWHAQELDPANRKEARRRIIELGERGGIALVVWQEEGRATSGGAFQSIIGSRECTCVTGEAGRVIERLRRTSKFCSELTNGDGSNPREERERERSTPRFEVRGA